MKVLLDLDGVLADFDRDAIDLSAPWVTWPPEARDRGHRYCTDYLGRASDRKKVRRIIETPGFFRELPLVPGARESVDWLMSTHDVWIVSKPLIASYTCASEKYAWVHEHFPELRQKVVLAPDKSMVAGDVLIDDAIVPQQAERATWTPIHYSYPHNKHAEGYHHNWSWGIHHLQIVLSDAHDLRR